MSTKKQNITALTTAIITPVKVFIGIDYHKRYSVYHVLDEAGKDVAIPPSLPDARPSSDRFRCAGRESKLLAGSTSKHSPPTCSQRTANRSRTTRSIATR